MSSERKLRIKTLTLVLMLVICANVGDLTLKRAMTEIGSVELSGSGLARALPLTITNWKVWVGIGFLVGFMASYMTVLSWADYSYVMPIGAFGYALLTVALLSNLMAILLQALCARLGIATGRDLALDVGGHALKA